MDIQMLAQQIVLFLAPFLPYLVKAGEKTAEEAGEKMGEDAWERAKTLWGKLRPKVEARPAAQEAALGVAQTPDDPDAQAALRLQLKKILGKDPTLAAEVTALVQQAIMGGEAVIESGYSAIAIGKGSSVTIGGNVSGSTIITGEQTSTPGEVCVCQIPNCDYRYVIGEMGETPPPCPTHDVPLIPADEKKER